MHYTIQRAATTMRLPVTSLWRLCQLGQVPAPSVQIGKRRFWTETEFEEVRRKVDSLLAEGLIYRNAYKPRKRKTETH